MFVSSVLFIFVYLFNLILVRTVLGPMANDVSTLVLAMEAVLVPKMWDLDPTVVPLPFNKEVCHCIKSNLPGNITVKLTGQSSYFFHIVEGFSKPG